MATTKHRSLAGRGGKKDFVQDKASPKKNYKHTNIKNLKKNIRANPLRASSKATRLFLLE